ncbi:MAG: response regulator [Kofleriaceae bacterium]
MNRAIVQVVLVDDHTIVRQGLRALLETQPDLAVVGEAATGEAAVELVREHAPEVVLMDVLMPGIGGVEATRRVRVASPRTQVVILTSSPEEESVVPALRAGALSYLSKATGATALVDAVRRAARGEAVLGAGASAQIARALRSDRGRPRHDELTARELEILRLVAEGLSNAAIAERFSLSEKTVKSHVSSVLAKLDLDDRTQAAVYAWREGLVHR